MSRGSQFSSTRGGRGNRSVSDPAPSPFRPTPQQEWPYDTKSPQQQPSMPRSPNDPNAAAAAAAAAAQAAAAEAAAAAAANAGYNYPYYPCVPGYPQPRLAARYTRASGSHLQQMYSPYSMQYQTPSGTSGSHDSGGGGGGSGGGATNYNVYVDHQNPASTPTSTGSLGYNIYPPNNASSGSPHQQQQQAVYQSGPYYDKPSTTTTTTTSSAGTHLLPTPTGSTPAWQQDTYHPQHQPHHHNDSTTSPHPSSWDRRKPSPVSPTASHFASVFGKMSVKRSSESSGSGSPLDRSPRPSVSKMSDEDSTNTTTENKPSGGNQFDWVL